MKTFRVYHHPVSGYVAVKQGFSWPALCFGVFWAVSHKLWQVAGRLCVGYGIIGVLCILGYATASPGAYLVAAMASVYLWGSLALQGNAYREYRLVQQGYTQLETMAAISPREAIGQAGTLHHGQIAP